MKKGKYVVRIAIVSLATFIYYRSQRDSAYLFYHYSEEWIGMLLFRIIVLGIAPAFLYWLFLEKDK